MDVLWGTISRSGMEWRLLPCLYPGWVPLMAITKLSAERGAIAPGAKEMKSRKMRIHVEVNSGVGVARR